MSLNHPVGPFNLGNTAHLNQEVAPDRVPLYTQLVNSYKWMEKVSNNSLLTRKFRETFKCFFTLEE